MGPIVSGIERRGSDRDYSLYRLYLLVFLRSIRETNPGATVYLFVDNIPPGDIERIKRVSAGIRLVIVRLSESTRKLVMAAENPNLGSMCSLRCFLPGLLDIDECAWIDCDTVVTGSLSGLFDDGRRACAADGTFLAAVIDSGWKMALSNPTDPYCNSGVCYMNLEGLRSSGEDKRLTRILLDIFEVERRRQHLADQDALNRLGCSMISVRWNCQRHPSLLGKCSRAYVDEASAVDRAVIYHALGVQKYKMAGLSGEMPDAFFKVMAGVVDEMGPSILSFTGGDEFMKRLKSVDKEEVF